eukprot:2494253-Prymnesium_polylepis.1
MSVLIMPLPEAEPPSSVSDMRPKPSQPTVRACMMIEMTPSGYEPCTVQPIRNSAASVRMLA